MRAPSDADTNECRYGHAWLVPVRCLHLCQAMSPRDEPPEPMISAEGSLHGCTNVVSWGFDVGEWLNVARWVLQLSCHCSREMQWL